MRSGGNETVGLITLLQGDEIVLSTDPSQSPYPSTKIVDGKSMFDETRNIFGDIDVQLMVNDASALALVPTSPSSALAPTSATEVQAGLGFVGADGVNYTTNLGVFDLAETNVVEQGGGLLIALQAFDRSRKLDRGKFVTPYTVAAGTNYVTAIQTIVQLAFPNVVFSAENTAYTTPLLTFDVQSTYLAAVQQMAKSIGYRIYFDSLGVCVLRPPDTDGDPQWTLAVGSDTRILDVERTLSDEKVYNGVIYRGEAPGVDAVPVQGEAWDLDPSSPTYYDPANPGASTYGPVPFFAVSEFITTTAQATDAAAARLPYVSGLVERVKVSTRLNPGIEPGDLISLERPRVGATGIYVAEAVGPLRFRSDRMRIVMRERRL
jgi:hypothetical protein